MIGEKLSDRYEIVSELGRGGMGVVYRALDPVLNRDVAIKLISPAMLTPETEQRFRTEAQVVAQLDHPAIVSIYDFGRHGDSLFFVMPVIEGTSLRDLIRDQSLKLGEIVALGLDVASALDYSHKRGVVHRDIKPENVMVSREVGSGLRVRIMDFGLARDSEVTRLTKTGMLIGTMSYVSPEQIQGLNIDGRSDLYSLATMLYECLAGDVPFTGDMQAILYRVVHEQPQPPREMGVEIDEELERILLDCLVKEPDRRPDAEGLVTRLRRYKAGMQDTDVERSMMATGLVHAPRPAMLPFAGRESELRELQSRLNKAVAGECQFVAVSGEPGVGKTRLLDEIASLAHARQIRVLSGRLVEQDGSFPYHGFCEAIQEYFQQKESGSTSSGLPDLSDLAADLISLFPMLAELEPIRSAATGSSQLAMAETRSPENQAQVFELLARTMTRLAAGRPLVLLLEELHGAEVSIEALQYIVRRLGPTPTLVVATYRASDVERGHPLLKMLDGFHGDRRFAAVELGPFSASDHRAFLGTLVAGSRVDDTLAVNLFEASEGNPFFTKELVRSLLDAGNIEQDKTGAWKLSGGTQISSDALPATIQQAVERRIGRLPDELRRILSIASVMGRTFDFRDLETLAGDEGDVDDAVDNLVKEGLIEEERQSRGDRLVFSSGVVREVLYGELSRRKRRTLHRKYAHQVEKRNSGRLERVYPQLVYHFAEGDVPEKSVEYGLLHAKKSLDAFSPDEGIRSAKTALEFIDEEWEGDAAVEGEVRLLLSSAYGMAGDVEAALKEAGNAAGVFEKHGRNDEALAALHAAARVAWQARRTEETRQWVERGLETARKLEASDTLRELLSLAATLAKLRGEYERAVVLQKEADQLAPRAEPSAAEELPRGGRLVVSLANPVRSSEPVTMQVLDEWEVFTNVFETLVVTEADGNLAPHLCERWDSADGGRVFTFKLREGVTFTDGTKLGAAEVKRSFEQSSRVGKDDLPAALAAIRGVAAFTSGERDEIEGLVVGADDTLEIRLEEPLPIYPALLTDGRTGILRRVGEGDGSLIGTGPFRLVSNGADKAVLERNPDYWTGSPPNVDAVEFRPGLSASEIVAGLRSEAFDIAGDLLPQDLETVLRDPRFGRRLVETVQKTTYFILFNSAGGKAGADERIRRALSGVVRPTDLVWETLGRFAQPAAGLLPAGILGHDAGLKRDALTVDEARELLKEAGVEGTLQLKAAVHPMLQDRNAALLDALLSVWRELGVEVTVETPDMETYLDAWNENEGIDLGLMRWGPDYDDPDNFTHNLFHSQVGQLRAWYHSDEADRLLESARAESRPASREKLYREFEGLLRDSAALMPLFQDLDYRISSPRVRGLRLGSISPYVNYRELGKAEGVASATEVRADVGGIVRAPMTAKLEGLDPHLTITVEQAEVLPCVYEPLMRKVGDDVVPWLARSMQLEEGGLAYRFRLREGVRFHDGRRLTARDVRFSFERLLQNPESESRWMYSPIAGAKDLLEGRATDLSGFEIHSAGEFTIRLEKPLSFFPAMITFIACAIIPEGTNRFGDSWREGAVGTGPFRVSSFEPGRRLELERNTTYWRDGLPRSQGLVFSFGVAPKEILAEFKAGRFSLAADLFPEDVDELRREAGFAAGYREVPMLSTYYVALNTRNGALENPELRARLAQALDVERLVKESLGQLAVPAQGLIPPGLAGHESLRRRKPVAAADPAQPADVELTLATHPVLRQRYGALIDGMIASLEKVGIRLKATTETMEEFNDAEAKGTVDVSIGRWIADYPDADVFAQILSAQEGILGRMCGSPELDRLVERGRTETDPMTRHSVYRQLEEVVSRQARLVPLFHEQVYRFAHPDLEGLTVSYWTPTVTYEHLRIRGK